MPAHALPREQWAEVESSFALETIDPGATGTAIYTIEPDVSSLAQAVLDNENTRVRPAAVHQKILGLKSEGTFPCSIYLTASGAHAIETATAVATIQADVLKAGLGGQHLGFAIGFSGGTAAAPEIDADPGYEAGDWIFALDTSTGDGEFYRVESIAALVLTLDRDLHFTPVADDVAHAVISIFVHQKALTDHSHAEHDTLVWKVQGEHTEDVYTIRGCKPAVTIDGITAGEPVKVSLEHQLVTFDWETAARTASGTPSGEAPLVPASGDDTSVRLADFGTPLLVATEVACRGTITPNLAITHEKVMGPCGVEGVNGFVGAGWGEGGPQILVEYDNAYGTDFRAQTKKHLYVQVGAGTSAWAIYWPRLEFAAEPARSEESSVTTSSLSMRAMEDTASTAGLSDDQAEKRRSPFVILMVA